MRVYLPKNVLQATYDRLEWIFTEFPVVVVNVSGGKDSTVLFHLALEVARARDRLPLHVFFLDQEAEWQATIDLVREWMYHPDVKPLWFQIPFRLSNATSRNEPWLFCWDPAAETRWIHPRDPIAFTENRYGTDRFHELFGAIFRVEFPDQKVAVLNGMRVEESPARYVTLTWNPGYQWVTWSSRQNDLDHWVFSPLYDWRTSDVWHAIAEHGWRYNRIYDLQFWYGLPVRKMRISSFHHEMSVEILFYLQEFEPETYDRLIRRIEGVHAASLLGRQDYFAPSLPPAFTSWRDYRDYLLDHLITNPEWRDGMRRRFLADEDFWLPIIGDELYHHQIESILTNDWEFALYGQRLVRIRREHYREAAIRQRALAEETAHAVD